MKTVLLLFTFILMVCTVYTQPFGPVQKLADQLNLYYSFYPNEKVFVRTDKDYYRPGETVWFACRALNVNTQIPVTTQDEVMLNLLAPDGETIISDKYILNKGFANGDFLLPENLNAGNYFIAALLPGQKEDDILFRKITIQPYYSNSLVVSATQKKKVLQKGTDNEISIQVKNLEDEAIKNQKLEYIISKGDQPIEEGKLKTGDTGETAVSFRPPANPDGTPFHLSVFDNKEERLETLQLVSETDRVNVCFYPEGGTLIPGVATKMGFYVDDKSGNPVDIEGEIRDSDNQLVTRVKTFWKGFGLFPLMASENGRYSLHITSEQGKGQQSDLPSVNRTGLSFSLMKSDAEFIWFNLVFADQLDHTVALTASRGGDVYWATDVPVKGSVTLKIPKENLPQGLVLFSCFSDKGFLLNQRIVDVSRDRELKIEINASSGSVRKGEDFELHIKTSDGVNRPVSCIVQVSASDKVWNKTLKPLLPFETVYNSVLKNKILVNEQEYQEGFSKQKVFDYFLIANELIDSDWPRITNFHAGKAPLKKMDEKGKVLFSDDIEKTLAEKVKDLNQSLLSSEKQLLPEEYFNLNKGLVAPKQKKRTHETPGNDSYKRFLESSTNLLDVIKMIKPFNLEGNKIVFPGGYNSINSQGGALIVIDGQQVGEDASALNNINPHDVEDINVSTSPIDIQRYTGLNSVGLIEITTKRGVAPKVEQVNKEGTPLYDGDYRIPREFSLSDKKDLRTTIYWNGQLVIDDSGKTSLRIPGAKIVSDFVITVDGLGSNGQFGHTSIPIKVTE